MTVQGAAVVLTVPAPMTRFVGREAELAFVADLLAESRFVTLTGPGGAGKTRLALRVASMLADGFPDGLWFVDFSPLSGDQFVWDQVAMTLGVAEPGSGRTLADAVGHQLAAWKALIVLDNCAHLVAAAAEVAAQLLAAAPAVKVLATSREPLAVAGEVTWTVPPLTEPDGFELFTDRARQARPELRLRDADAEAVRSICHRLDGLPLAIELAAARTRALAPSRIAAHLAPAEGFDTAAEQAAVGQAHPLGTAQRPRHAQRQPARGARHPASRTIRPLPVLAAQRRPPRPLPAPPAKRHRRASAAIPWNRGDSS